MKKTTIACIALLIAASTLVLIHFVGCSAAEYRSERAPCAAASLEQYNREREMEAEEMACAEGYREFAARYPSDVEYDAHPPPIPGSLPSPDEELWIIQKPSEPAPATDDDMPGSGAMLAKRPGEEKEIPLPLKHTDVQARISAYIAAVDVTQQYHNPYDEKIEAVYVFPLPENAAVNEFIMTIGDRRIRGIIKEREEAERTYEEAKRQGFVASLLTQERPNVFTQKVANIEPGKAIDVNITYFHTLAYMDGWYEYVFPMVVGPRFNPPSGVAPASPPAGSGIGAVGRGRHGQSGQSTEVQYLKPGERSGHDISLAVNIDAGVAIEEVESRNHVIAVSRPSPDRSRDRKGAFTSDPNRPDVHRDKGAFTSDPNRDRKGADAPDQSRDREGAVGLANASASPLSPNSSQVSVKLSELDAIPNKDFVLRYKVAGPRIKSALLTHQDQRGGFFSLMVYPPEDLKALTRQPLELIFLLDCSGSMSGDPIAQSKKAVERALRSMMPDDTFQIIRFSNNASQLGGKPVAATPENVRKGLAYLKSLEGEGGTMMIEGIKAALDFPHDPRRLRFVAFLTDGYIGNEAEILAEVHKRLGASRIFSFGVGSSPNRYLLDGLARMGNGAAAYLSLNDDAGKVMDLFFERIAHPALTDLRIDWGSLQVADVFPSRAPDLFVGRPVIVTGRFTPPSGNAAHPRPVHITVTGNTGGRPTEIVVSADLGDAAAKHTALAAVWARTKIADLSYRALYEGSASSGGANELAGEIKQVALEYSLMSAYTAFVAVDALAKTAGDHGTTVPVAVPVPDGVKYETTVEE